MKNISKIGIVVSVLILMVWAGIYMFFYQKHVLSADFIAVEKVTVSDDWVTMQGFMASSATLLRDVKLEQSKDVLTITLYGSLAGSMYQPKEPYEAKDAWHNVFVHEKGNFRHVTKIYIKDEQGKHLVWSKVPRQKKK